MLMPSKALPPFARPALCLSSFSCSWLSTQAELHFEWCVYLTILRNLLHVLFTSWSDAHVSV